MENEVTGRQLRIIEILRSGKKKQSEIKLSTDLGETELENGLLRLRRSGIIECNAFTPESIRRVEVTWCLTKEAESFLARHLNF